ncbi:MAG: amidase family protein [Candidatus Woesearchaeota archaeon]
MEDIIESTYKVIEECRKINKEYHYFNAISEDLAVSQARHLKKNPRGKLLGYFISVKDNICVKGVESCAGSAILKGYLPVFNATAVQRAIDEGAIIIGKTSQDEFGFGSFSTNMGVGFLAPKNPFDKGRVCGGSSGGSGGITQVASFPHISLGESTGGSIAAPASFCGVIGLCPTYGRVSRYGLIDYASSMDKIGPMAKSIKEAALMLEVISGFDANDSTTLNAEVDNYTQVSNSVRGFKIGLIKEAFGEGVEQEVRETVLDAVKVLEREGAEVEEINLPITAKYSVPAYYLLAVCEASTNLAKYCGMRYGAHEKLDGNFNKYFSEVRHKHLGDEAKRRIMLGTFARMSGFRDAYYLKALKVRTKIINEYKNIFKRFDAIVSPTMPLLPPKFEDIKSLTPLQNYLMDIMTVGPNLAGMPHLSINVGMRKSLPVGMLITADHLKEKTLMQIGSVLE